MDVKKFLKPTKNKIMLTIVIFLVILYLSFKIGRVYRDPYENFPEDMKPFGGLFPHKLNPILWLPAPLFTQKHSYIEYFPVDTNLVMISSFAYWIVISYFLSCLIVWFHKKVKK